MPHALIGYAGSTVDAARLYHDTFPDELTVLVDYFGQEITDALLLRAPSLIWHERGASQSGWIPMVAATPKVLMCRNPMLCWNAMLPMPFAATVMMRN